FPGLELPDLAHVRDDANRPGTDARADRAAGDPYRAAAPQREFLEVIPDLVRGYGLGARLHHVELLIDAVLRPFHVHGHGAPGLPGVVAFDLHGVIGQGEDVLIRDAVAVPVRLRR